MTHPKTTIFINSHYNPIFMAEEEGRTEHDDFVTKMLNSAKESKKTKPYKSTDEDPEEVENALKKIRDKIQQNG